MNNESTLHRKFSPLGRSPDIIRHGLGLSDVTELEFLREIHGEVCRDRKGEVLTEGFMGFPIDSNVGFSRTPTPYRHTVWSVTKELTKGTNELTTLQIVWNILDLFD